MANGIMFMVIYAVAALSIVSSLLYPYESQSRERKDLSGLWSFKAEQPNSLGTGFAAKWFMLDISQLEGSITMPVPSAYNDITQSKGLRDMVGWVWYQRTFMIPAGWKGQRVVLRFDSVNYFTSAWLNGDFLTNHTGGHLPFEVDVNSCAIFGSLNRLTVAVNNTLSHFTLPPGEFVYKDDTTRYPDGWFEQELDFDFFNYAGILRFVSLYVTPLTYIYDVTVITEIQSDTGIIYYKVLLATSTSPGSPTIKVMLRDKQHKAVSTSSGSSGRLAVQHAHLWWPIGMSNETAYLYKLEITLTVDDIDDVYELPVGIRTVKVTPTQFLVNGAPFYFKGYGMHEDADIRGRGFDYAVMIKDLNLLEWTGANSFRTSHYPYAEERMLECDKRGIVVMDQVSAVHTGYFYPENLALHQKMLRDLISRDKNHPSVVLWSLANEPKTELPGARDYFRAVVDLAHSLDRTRPVNIVYSSNYELDKTADLVDVICVNRYQGWYHEIGHTELIQKLVTVELSHWHSKYGKPIIMTEYGAGSIAGMNTDPPVAFTESYQAVVAEQNHKAFDQLRTKFLVGELIWNFADFMTAQGYTRVNGNRKGVFTRQRQPKMVAYVMKKRYESLRNTASGHCTVRTVCS